jgi:tRNA (guanine10-N2)-methyltransferase
MEYMIRFTQVHETFRLAEIEALAVLEGIKLEVLSYSPSVSYSLPIFSILAHKIEVTILLRKIAIWGSSHQTRPTEHSRQSDL